MVVLGAEAIEFVVVQFSNQVEMEDCQEVDLAGTDENGVAIAIDEEGIRGGGGMAYLRSKI